jgi:hypothetical protein
MREMRNIYRILIGNSGPKSPLRYNKFVEARMILKWRSEECD